MDITQQRSSYARAFLKGVFMKNLIASYIETALWSSLDHNDEPLDSNYNDDDLSEEAMLKSTQDCAEFIRQAGDLLKGLSLNQVMHDFWLTRNHHGAGFWDGDYEYKVGKKLTEIAHGFGEVNLYVGDDNKLYLM